MENQSRDHRLDHGYDEFHESLAPTMGRTFPVQREDTHYQPASGTRTGLQAFVATVASLLNLALIIRLITHLLSGDITSSWVNFVDSATNWLVAPFQSVFTSLPLNETAYFDLPALAAILAITATGYLLNRLLRDSRRQASDRN